MFCKLVPNAGGVALMQCNAATVSAATAVNYREVAGFSYQVSGPAHPSGLCWHQAPRHQGAS
jgi:hypothetical protein